MSLRESWSNEPHRRPLSAREISVEADKFSYNPQIPLKYWARALDTLGREGKNYLYEGNYAKAYLLLMRYSSLYLEHISKHPDAKKPEGKKLLTPFKGQIDRILTQIEEIRKHLDKAYEEWEKITQTSKFVQDDGASTISSHTARDAALSWNADVQAKLVDITDNQDLAVDLATKELQRRDAARRGVRRAGVTAEEEANRRGGRVWDSSGDQDELQRQMEVARWRLDSSQDRQESSEESTIVPSAHYNYPTIAKSKGLQLEPLRSLPSRPAKAAATPSNISNPALSARYSSPLPIPASQDGPPARPPKAVEKLSAKNRVTFKPAGYLENGDPIRPVFLPDNLRHQFVKLAAETTRRGIEMCGLLCGTSVNNALFITTLLIPEQKGTTDTCETTNEAATFDYMDKEDLIQLGWIHTHPTQTCFMSSRDLHTQAGYQIMMPESIAIVCAPKFDPSWGIFRLTNPPGLPHILQCGKTTTFHEHDVPANRLYADAAHPPGHVYVTSRMDFKIHDLRT